MEFDIKNKTKIHNRFDIVVRDVSTGEVVQKGQAENIVLNRMYTKLVTFSGYFSYIVFGTGTGTVDPTRTTLFSRAGAKTASQAELIRAFPTSKWTKVIRLEAAEYNGNILTEVGISEEATNVNTHALITDAEGNPLSIEKTLDRIIDIFATVFVTFIDMPQGEWYTGLRDFLAGGSSAPSSTLLIMNKKHRSAMSQSRSATATSDSVARTRTLTTQFDNYQTLGTHYSENVRYGQMFGGRNMIEIPVTHIGWSGVGALPVVCECERIYEYTISADEAALNRLFLNFMLFDTDEANILEVRRNGDLVGDYGLLDYGEFNMQEGEISYMHPLVMPASGFWYNFIVNKFHPYGSMGTGTSFEAYSEEGFNLVLEYYRSFSWYYVKYTVYTKDNLEDAWVQENYYYGYELEGGWSSTRNVVFSYQTSKKYLKITAGYDSSSGSGSMSRCQIYALPIMTFGTVVLAVGDKVTIKRRHVNETPKGNTYLLDTSAKLTFGEGV